MNDSDEIVIVSAVRTPFSPFGGMLREMHSTDLGALVIREVLQRVNLSGDKVDELYYGMCIQSEAALESNVNGRQALLKAGMPAELVSLTIDRACCSSLTAIQLGMRTILAGDGKIIMAVGAENMSNTPLVMNGHRWGTRLQLPVFKDHLNPIYYTGYNALAKAPGYAINKALQKVDMSMSEIHLIEINEAFAAMPLVFTQVLANGDHKKCEELREITNINGGAIAIGHPVGASGARILMTLMYELRRRGGGFGAAGICGGLAQADAAIIKVEQTGVG